MTAPETSGTERPRLDDLSVALVGPGRVGLSLCRWARDLGAAIVAVAGRPGSSTAQRAARDLGARWARLDELGETAPDVTLLAVPDPVLSAVAQQLAAAPPSPIVLHVSGSVDRRVLHPLEDLGTQVGSLHPLMAFSRVRPTPPTAERPWFAVDGTPAALELARRLAEAWGGRWIEVEGEERRAYHLAASLAAGGVSTLLGLAFRIARQSGLPADVLPAYLDLARGALDGIEELGDPDRAVTGPIARGDLEVVAAHREALRRVAPEALELWSALGRSTLAGIPAETLSPDRRKRLGELLRRPLEEGERGPPEEASDS